MRRSLLHFQRSHLSSLFPTSPDTKPQMWERWEAQSELQLQFSPSNGFGNYNLSSHTQFQTAQQGLQQSSPPVPSGSGVVLVPPLLPPRHFSSCVQTGSRYRQQVREPEGPWLSLVLQTSSSILSTGCRCCPPVLRVLDLLSHRRFWKRCLGWGESLHRLQLLHGHCPLSCLTSAEPQSSTLGEDPLLLAPGPVFTMRAPLQSSVSEGASARDSPSFPHFLSFPDISPKPALEARARGNPPSLYQKLGPEAVLQ